MNTENPLMPRSTARPRLALGVLLSITLLALSACQSPVVREYSEDTTRVISSEQAVGGAPAPSSR